MQKLGRYELGPVLGEGGAGRVYDATLCGPGGFRKPVALKVLHSGTEELRREARIGGLLRHRNLVDVYEIGEEDGRWFCALERCDGTLADHAPLPDRALAEVALQVCAALQYAHEELGLVHLDIKPSNLLLADGVVKVADLGIARAQGFEHDGRIRGTPSYMAPEQAAGMQVDPRADVYALGITLHDLAVGAGTPAVETMDMDVLGDPATLDFPEAIDPESAEAPSLPEWLEPIVDRCIAPDPRERWPDMATLAAAIAEVQVSGPGLREVVGWSEEPPHEAEDRATNLGREQRALVGRTTEVDRILAAMEAPCLVTLKGPAGIGKSRLAREVARQWHGRGHEAWYVDLVEVVDADDLVAAVAWTLRAPVAEHDLEARVVQVGDMLANRGTALLVFDNFEHLLALGPLLERWAGQAPELRIAVTSRVRLELDGERVVEVPPLEADAAVALLVERAAERGAHVADDPDLPELAHRLDGLPLALELAAGRLGVLSVRDVLDRLGLSLLRQADEGRHGTLRAALDWSWELLGPTERAALGQLSVFAGGFTLEAAEGVLDLGGASVLDAVASLVDRSMCQALGNRFDLLLSVQDYARARHGEDPPLRRRHAAWFARRGTHEAIESLFRHGSPARRAALAEDVENLVAACRNAVDDGMDDLATNALAAAWAVLELRGPYHLASELLDRVLSRRETVEQLDRALLVGSRIRHLDADNAQAEALAIEGAEVARQAGHAQIEVECLGGLLNVQQVEGNPDARGRMLEVREKARACGHQRVEAHMLTLLGMALAREDTDAAERYLEQAIAMHQAQGNRRVEGLAWGNLANVWRLRGDLERSEACTRAALEMAREVGSQRSVAIWLGNLGILMRLQGRPEEAKAHYLAALEVHRQVGNRRHAGSALGNLGRLAVDAGELDEAKELIERALVDVRAGGDRRSEAIWIANLGSIAKKQGDLEGGEALVQEGIALAEAIGLKRLAVDLARSLGG